MPSRDHVATVPAPTAKTPSLLTVIAWSTALVALPLYSHLVSIEHGQKRLVSLMSEYWFFLWPILLIILMIGGKLGAGLGLPGVFRDPPPPRPDVGTPTRGASGRTQQGGFGAAFWGSFGAALLVAQVWTAIYYSERITHLNDYVEYAIEDTRHEYPTFVAAVHEPNNLLRFVAKCSPPFLVFLLLAAALPASVPGATRRGQDSLNELLRYVLGMIVAAVSLIVIVKLAGLVHTTFLEGVDIPASLRRLHQRHSPHLRSHFLAIEQFPERYDGLKATVITSFTLYLGLFAAEWLVFVFFFRDSLSPGLAVCALFSGFVVAGSITIALDASVRLPITVLVLVVLALTNNSAYKYQFPGMESYYKNRVALRTLDPDATVPIHSIPDDHALEMWRARMGEAKPKLLMVSVTGGAYRASFWASVVLDDLCGNPALPGMARHIRIMTGSSGGMVGSAYFAATMTPHGRPSESLTERLRRESKLDSLTPIIRHLIRRDLPLTVWPFPQKKDRGIVLENQWPALDVTFLELSQGEREGWRPSLIVSPMIVETGRRLLISNLNLHNLTETTAEMLHKVSRHPGEPRSALAARLYSRSAAEFFQVFPDSIDTFKLRTAVRMNASFPYISPAVSLPIEPPRRVVDAGYFDDYGVDLAATWAYLNREWIAENTSGLGLIQIRAARSEANRKDFFVPGRDTPPGWTGWFAGALSRSLQWLTSPVEGAFSARDWSMSFRNDQLVRVLDDTLNHNDERRFFETFIFENPAEFAMNWFVSDDDIRAMQYSIGASDVTTNPAEPGDSNARAAQHDIDQANAQQKQLLIDWWNS